MCNECQSQRQEGYGSSLLDELAFHFRNSAPACACSCQPPAVQPIVRDGLSTYEIWLDAGNRGTVADFLQSQVPTGGGTGTPTGSGTFNMVSFTFTEEAPGVNGSPLPHTQFPATLIGGQAILPDGFTQDEFVKARVAVSNNVANPLLAELDMPPEESFVGTFHLFLYPQSSAVIVPAKPTGLQVGTITATAAAVSWVAVASVPTYDVQYKKDAAPGDNDPVQSVTDPAIALGALSGSTKYYVRVRSRRGNSVSAWSESVSFDTLQQVLPVLSGITVTAKSPTELTISWPRVTGAVNYLIERSLNGQTGWSPRINALTATTDPVTMSESELEADTPYYYRVRARNAQGNFITDFGTASGRTQVAPPPPAVPTGLATANITQTGFTLNWTPASGATGYTVEYTAAGGQAQTLNVTGATATLTGLTAATAYSVRVRSTNANGQSNYSQAVSATTQSTTPTTPALSGLGVAVLSTRVLRLSWPAVANATRYVVERSTTGTGGWQSVNDNVPATSGTITLDDSGLNPGTTYYYRAKAVGASGDLTTYGTASGTTSPETITTTPPSWWVDSGYTRNEDTRETSIHVKANIPAGSNLLQRIVTAPGRLGVDGAKTAPAAENWGLGAWQPASLSPFAQQGYGPRFPMNPAVSGIGGVLANTGYYTEYCLDTAMGSVFQKPMNIPAGTVTTTPGSLTPSTIPGAFSATANTQTQITLNWQSVSSAQRYELQYKLHSSSSWQDLGGNNLTTNSKVHSGLTAATQYDYQLRSVLAGGGFSDWTSVTRSTLPNLTLVISDEGTTVSIAEGGQHVLNATPPSGSGYIVQWMRQGVIDAALTTGLSYTVVGTQDIGGAVIYATLHQTSTLNPPLARSGNVTFEYTGTESTGNGGDGETNYVAPGMTLGTDDTPLPDQIDYLGNQLVNTQTPINP